VWFALIVSGKLFRKYSPHPRGRFFARPEQFVQPNGERAGDNQLGWHRDYWSRILVGRYSGCQARTSSAKQ
jgi:hypothetical protein